MTTATYTALGKYLDLLLDAICVVDKDGHFMFVSAGGERIFGYRPDEMIGRQMLELIHPEDKDKTLKAVDHIVAGQPEPHFENRYIRKNGDVVHIMWSARWSEEDQCRIAVARDITLRKQAEAMQQAVFAIAEASHTSDDLCSLYPQIHQIIGGLLPAVNCVIALYDSLADCISFPYYVDKHTSAPAPQSLGHHSGYAQLIREGEPLLLDTAQLADPQYAHFLDADNVRKPLSWLGVPLKMQGRPIGALVIKSYTLTACYSAQTVELLNYVSTQIATAIERHQMMARLQQRALYDQLTRLPNRDLFYDRIQSAIARARRNRELISLLFVDLDKFKEVNDRFGHQTGDLLLEAVARRLELSVRECDTVARFGGDEFVVLLENIDHPEQSDRVVEKIIDHLRSPIELAGNLITITASIGMAHFPLHGDNEKDLLHHADNAMYASKTQTR
ncbi:diguanylate cyclase [Cellvibrio mixtus]|uniref:Diguanylate cyclase n=1 Tax=Cellvibrio mixtus TaxID=39650 RepID=A0A266QAW8_9GAMM|nr:diguanylate cyclase [Cellvibrio mixtus]OZY86985.1 diguanylate cyclase [Cellvibrio mixtus]